MYHLSLNIAGIIYESEGETMLETLQKLPYPAKIFQKGILTVMQGERKLVKMFMPSALKKIWSKSAVYYQAKYLELLLK